MHHGTRTLMERPYHHLTQCVGRLEMWLMEWDYLMTPEIVRL